MKSRTTSVAIGVLLLLLQIAPDAVVAVDPRVHSHWSQIRDQFTVLSARRLFDTSDMWVLYANKRTPGDL